MHGGVFQGSEFIELDKIPARRYHYSRAVEKMEITSLVWNQTNITHIAAHHVIPEEVEEICKTKPLILTTPTKGPNPVYYVLGQSQAGRYLFAVVIYFGKGQGYVVTARNMSDHERRRFLRWKKR